MKTIIAILIVLAVAFGAIAIVGGIWGLKTYNTAVEKQTLYNSKEKANTASFDNMWKSISQVVQVSDKQKDALKDIIVSHASARSAGSDNDQLLMKWIQESVPNVDRLSDTYNNLMNIIVSQRESWTMRQLELVDIANSYNLFYKRQPNKLFLNFFGFKEIVANVVTSSRTEEAFKTGKDDIVDLSPKK